MLSEELRGTQNLLHSVIADVILTADKSYNKQA
jgi:hypothetical protein